MRYIDIYLFIMKNKIKTQIDFITALFTNAIDKIPIEHIKPLLIGIIKIVILLLIVSLIVEYISEAPVGEPGNIANHVSQIEITDDVVIIRYNNFLQQKSIITTDRYNVIFIAKYQYPDVRITGSSILGYKIYASHETWNAAGVKYDKDMRIQKV